jgi:hypothetical protein
MDCAWWPTYVFACVRVCCDIAVRLLAHWRATISVQRLPTRAVSRCSSTRNNAYAMMCVRLHGSLRNATATGARDVSHCDVSASARGRRDRRVRLAGADDVAERGAANDVAGGAVCRAVAVRRSCCTRCAHCTTSRKQRAHVVAVVCDCCLPCSLWCVWQNCCCDRRRQQRQPTCSPCASRC